VLGSAGLRISPKISGNDDCLLAGEERVAGLVREGEFDGETWKIGDAAADCALACGAVGCEA